MFGIIILKKILKHENYNCPRHNPGLKTSDYTKDDYIIQKLTISTKN